MAIPNFFCGYDIYIPYRVYTADYQLIFMTQDKYIRIGQMCVFRICSLEYFLLIVLLSLKQEKQKQT